MQVTLNIEGAKEIEKKLLSFEQKLGKKIVRQALREGAKVIQIAQKSNANAVIGGELGSKIADNIIVRAWKKMRRYVYGIMILINPQEESFIYYTKDGERYYLPAAIEYGHAFPGRGGSKNPPKDVSAMPYLRPAFDSEVINAERVIIEKLKQGIEQVGAEK